MEIVINRNVTPPNPFTRDGTFKLWTLGHLTAGNAEIVVGGVRRRIGPGWTSLVRPGTTYWAAPYPDRADWGKGEPWGETFVFFSPPAHWRPLLNWPEIAPGFMALEETRRGMAAPFAKALEEARAHFCGHGAHRDLWAVNAFERALLIADSLLPKTNVGQGMDGRIKQAVEYLTAHASREVSIQELAGAVHLSASRLAHLFKREMGVSPHRFLETHRLGAARGLLLSTSLPVSEVARRSGYANAFHFSTRFRRAFGVSPRGYRATPAASERGILENYRPRGSRG
jgi:AraC family transcriptional regulator, arabinose operon regulatory protein